MHLYVQMCLFDLSVDVRKLEAVELSAVPVVTLDIALQCFSQGQDSVHL
jgi:hypothetical protein